MGLHSRMGAKVFRIMRSGLGAKLRLVLETSLSCGTCARGVVCLPGSARRSGSMIGGGGGGDGPSEPQ